MIEIVDDLLYLADDPDDTYYHHYLDYPSPALGRPMPRMLAIFLSLTLFLGAFGLDYWIIGETAKPKGIAMPTGAAIFVVSVTATLVVVLLFAIWEEVSRR